MSDDDSELEREFDQRSNSDSEEIDLGDFSDDDDEVSDDDKEIPEISDPEGASIDESDDDSINESDEDEEDEDEEDSDLEELEESEEEEVKFLKKQSIPKRQSPTQKTPTRRQHSRSPERPKPSTRVEPVKSVSKFDVPKASTARRTVTPSDVQKIAEQLRSTSPSYRRKSERKVPANSYVDPVRKEIKGAYPNLSETEAEALSRALLDQVKYGVVYDGMSNAVLRDIMNRVSARLS
jgi:hypothetical protein